MPMRCDLSVHYILLSASICAFTGRPEVTWKHGVSAGVRNANHIDNNTSALSLRLDDEDLGYIDDCLKLSKPPKGDIYSYEREG